MKLLVFAHTPPPHHGQSYMVKLMLDGFGGDQRKSKPHGELPNAFGIECYHVNARFSKSIEDIGEFQGAKIFLILFFCVQAIWCRFRYGVTNFYYVPASGGWFTLFCDWLVMLICRPFFQKTIFHWHNSGLAKWLETAVQIRARILTYWLMKNADLSIVPTDLNRTDAEKLTPLRVVVVANGTNDLTLLGECIRSVECPESTTTQKTSSEIPSGDFSPKSGFQIAPAKLKLALTILAENPLRKTGLTTLFHEFVARSLILFPDVSWLIFAGPNQPWRVADPRVEVIRDFPANDRLARRLLADHFQVPAVARERGAQALLTVGFVPIGKCLPTVMHMLSLQTLDKRNRLGFLRQIYRNSMIKYNWPQADWVITNSKWTASQVLSLHPEFHDRMTISYEGLQHEIFQPAAPAKEPQWLKDKFGIEPAYFLWISNFYPYKQAERLIAGYARLDAETRRRHPLVMAGGNWLDGLEVARAQARLLGVEPDVKFLGWIDDESLAPLYRQASVFCLASREETFGRCVIEAMACGTPCLVNDIPIMREVTGGNALIVDFQQPDIVADALRKIVHGVALAAQLRAQGLAHVREFTFEKLTRERITAIQKLISVRSLRDA